MENISLYDLLVGCFVFRGDDPGDADHTYFDQIAEDEKRRLSIAENLKMILQSRRGSVVHLPDFGMPDIMQVYLEQGMVEPVLEQIRETILKYEPRIEKAQVLNSDFDRKNMRISLKIITTIKDSPTRDVLLTEFSTTGWTKVEFMRDADEY